ncbi:MAG: sodium:proton antiporter [Halioglobus sp.]
MIVDAIGQVLALASLTVVGLLVTRFTRIDLTLACLLTGFVTGLTLGYVDFDTGIRAHNLHEIVFFIILPVLIFEAAWHIKLTLLKRWLLPVLLLATAGVLISTFVTAGLVYVGIGYPDAFPWLAALLTGAILAATDPIAVMSQLRSSNAPEDLATLFEGESLFNDASAIVLFLIIIAIATQAEHGQTGYLSFFGMVFVGGIAVGLVAGLLTAAIIRIIGRPEASRFILVFSAFISFYAAEHLLHVSGIMAVMMAAIAAKLALKEVENTLTHGIIETWEWLGLFLNNLLFVIMGLVITVSMFTEQWLAMLIAIVATFIARVIAVVGVSLVSGGLGRPVPWGWQILLVWGGLRGAIAIALVLSLPTSLPYWWLIQSMVFGVVMFSLLVQGTTNKFLIERYARSD